MSESVLGDLGDDVKSDAAGFLLRQVHHDVDHAVGARDVDGNVLQVQPVRQDGRFQEGAEALRLRVVRGCGVSLARPGPV